MKHTQKGSVNMWLILIIILLLIAVSYFAFFKNLSAPAQPISISNSEVNQMQQTQQTQTQTQTAQTPVSETVNDIKPVNQSPVDTALKITSVFPTSLSTGQTITITGKGFSTLNPVRRTGMAPISDAQVMLQGADGKYIPVYDLQQGTDHSDTLLSFTLPSQICKFSERGCGSSDPASSYYHIVPGTYKLLVQVPSTDYFTNSVNINVVSGR